LRPKPSALREGFAESNILWREPNLMLSANSSLARVKKYSWPRIKLSEKNFFTESKKKTLGEEFFAEVFSLLSVKKFFKKYFSPSIFLSSKGTYTKDMFKFDTILSLFAIFEIFTSF
jgi:hypothetical protein